MIVIIIILYHVIVRARVFGQFARSPFSIPPTRLRRRHTRTHTHEHARTGLRYYTMRGRVSTQPRWSFLVFCIVVVVCGDMWWRTLCGAVPKFRRRANWLRLVFGVPSRCDNVPWMRYWMLAKYRFVVSVLGLLETSYERCCWSSTDYELLAGAWRRYSWSWWWSAVHRWWGE